MKNIQTQLLVILAAFLGIIFGYSLINNLFSPQGLEIMRDFYHQGGGLNIYYLLSNLSLGKSFLNASIQWGLLVAVLMTALWGYSWLNKLSEAIISIPRKYFLSVIFFTALGILLVIMYYKNQLFPRSGDSNAILFQAKILAKGALTVPSHPLKEFFDSDYIINNGRMYSEYPLGSSFFMMLGGFFGATWIVNPILGSLALIFIYFTTKDLYDEQIARYGVMLLLTSHLYYDLSSTYLSHAPLLCFISIFIYYFLKTLRLQNEESKNWHPLMAGIALGIAANTRSLSALTISLPLLIWGVYLLIKDWKAYFRRVIWFAIGILPFIVLIFLVNRIQNGNALLFGHQVYNGPRKIVGFSHEYRIRQAISTLFFRIGLLLKMVVYPPLRAGSLLFIIGLTFKNFKKENLLLWGFFTTTCLGYLFVVSSIWQYRYYYSATLYLFPLLALGAVNLGEWIKEFGLNQSKKLISKINGSALLNALWLAMVLTAFGSAFFSCGLKPHRKVPVLKKPYTVAEQAKLDNAIVFIRAVDEYYPQWYTRNSPDLNDPVLWVRDLGKCNQELLKYYPDRKAYIYDKGKLIPYFTDNQ